MNNAEIYSSFQGQENVELRNDLIRIVDQIAEDPNYSLGARRLKRFVTEATMLGQLPEEIILNPGVEYNLETSLEENQGDAVYNHSVFDYDPKIGVVTLLNGEVIALTPNENNFLKVLSNNPNKYVTQKKIIEGVWDDYFRTSTNVNHLAYRLRNKLPFWDSNKEHSIIKTRPRIGYMLCDPSKPKEIIVEREEEKVIEIPQVKEVLVYKHRHFEFRPEINMLTINGVDIRLTDLESRYMELFSKSQNGYVSFVNLLTAHYTESLDKQLVRREIANLRKKIRQKGKLEEQIFENVENKGYLLLP